MARGSLRQSIGFASALRVALEAAGCPSDLVMLSMAAVESVGSSLFYAGPKDGPLALRSDMFGICIEAYVGHPTKAYPEHVLLARFGESAQDVPAVRVTCVADTWRPVHELDDLEHDDPTTSEQGGGIRARLRAPDLLQRAADTQCSQAYTRLLEIRDAMNEEAKEKKRAEAAAAASQRQQMLDDEAIARAMQSPDEYDAALVQIKAATRLA